MNSSTPRYLLVAVLASILIGGGFYVAARRTVAGHEEKGHGLPTEPVTQSGAKGGDATASRAIPASSRLQNLPAAPALTKRPNVFGLNGPVQLEDVPEGRFRNELIRLDEPARRRALDKLGKLQVPLNDVASLSVEANGQLFYQCTPPRLPPAPPSAAFVRLEAQGGLPVAPEKTEAAASVPITTPPVRHSRPGATKVIYLDFNGHSISGTSWNQQKGNSGDANYRPAVATYVAKPFDADGNPTSFSDAEQAIILSVWERVAEDYKPFDVDVTTEEPASFTSTTGRVLITDNVDANGVNMPSSTSGGVAYLDVFGNPSYVSFYSPALVYANQNYNYASYIAETASHEMGHNLSLSHDGTSSGDEYYNGHGSGETSWNTIMGGAFTENVTQWSKGEYYNANNLEDDLAIIAGHLGYVPDDHTDSNGSATPLTVSGLTVSCAGVISPTGEADRFSFASGPGSISITATPFRSANQSHGGNLDAALELYDAGGSLVASANVDGVTAATLNATVAGGTYYLRLFGAGSGAPMNYPPSGYTSYGSLGQYTISGTVVSTAPVAPNITNQPVSVTVFSGQSAQFSVSASGYPAPTYQWQRLPAGSGIWANLSDGGAYSGTSTTALAVIPTIGMNGDQFRCVATNSAGSTTSNGVTLSVNAALLPVISGLPSTVTLNYGDTLSLSPSVTGTQPITYQWKKGGADLGGAASSSYNKSNATPADNGSYNVTVTNAAGSVTSSNVTVTVNPAVAPTITQQPLSLSVTQGLTVNFSVTATGTNPLAFQWYFNGQSIAAATSAVLSIANVQPVNAGSYTVTVVNPGGSITSNAAMLDVSPGVGVVAADSGWRSSVFIKSDGTLWAMGLNDYGQLGDGTTTKRYSPIQIATEVAAATTGTHNSLFIKSDGTLWGMGLNIRGELGIGTSAQQLNPIQIATGVVAATTGSGDINGHSLFIKSDGTLWAMGYGGYGGLGDGTGNDQYSPVQIATEVVAVSAGYLHTLFIKADGTLWAMGENDKGQLGVGPLTYQLRPIQIATGVASVSAGGHHSLFIKFDGTLWGMGFNSSGQLGDGTTTSRDNPIQIATGVVAAAAGWDDSLFIRSDSTLWAMGFNGDSQLGNGTPYNLTIPTQIATNVTSVAAGDVQSLFTKSDGTLWAMGWNGFGALGDGTNTAQYSPEQIVVGALKVPNPPSGVIANFGTPDPVIRLTWRPTIAATSYEVWSNTANNSASATRIASNVPIALFYDLTAVSGTNYFYWIKAVNSSGASGFSSSATNMLPPNNAVITITVE